MIADLLKEDAREEAESSFSSRLREGASVQVHVPQPERLVVAVPTKGSPSRGNPTAPVTVVEFADFECPPCGRMYPQLEEALETYGDRARVVFRQFPLAMHPHARRAAEASMAARAQGRFWELADRLFRNQKALDDASLRKYAVECGLDAERFGRAILELGGNNGMIVAPSADLELALRAIVFSAVGTAGDDVTPPALLLRKPSGDNSSRTMTRGMAVKKKVGRETARRRRNSSAS